MIRGISDVPGQVFFCEGCWSWGAALCKNCVQIFSISFVCLYLIFFISHICFFVPPLHIYLFWSPTILKNVFNMICLFLLWYLSELLCHSFVQLPILYFLSLTNLPSFLLSSGCLISWSFLSTYFFSLVLPVIFVACSFKISLELLVATSSSAFSNLNFRLI